MTGGVWRKVVAARSTVPMVDAARFERMEPTTACARHPDRPAVTVCVRCERSICMEDLVEAPVGYQCVDCARTASPVHRLGDLDPTPNVTRALVGAIVAVAALEAIGAVDVRAFALIPLLVGAGEWWRLVTSALLHAGIVHLAFNGILLWRLGAILEQRVGGTGLLGIAASGMAGGGLGVVGLAWLTVATDLTRIPLLGVVLATDPRSLTVGASGAVFGLMGAILVLIRREGIDPWTTDIGSMVGSLVLLNLILTFLVPVISVGGHVGGLLGGMLAGSITPTGRRAAFLQRLSGSVIAIVLLLAARGVATGLLAQFVG
jgi:membrane associated rhomboid family serine protease